MSSSYSRHQPRIEPKRRAGIDYKKKQFATPTFKAQEYPYRLNFYDVPPVEEITLEQFETWGIDRLKVLAELEACSYRNKTHSETLAHMTPIIDKHLKLSSNSSAPSNVSPASDSRLRSERRKDHYSHFILRLAFAATEDLRARFVRLETMLFRLRYITDDSRERAQFVKDLKFDWEEVSDAEKEEYSEQLLGATHGLRNVKDENWFKVDWEKVPELVERRQVFLRKGKAYVPGREQMSMVVAEFLARLKGAMELTARALPRLDEDDRLSPILTHLSSSFGSSSTIYADNEGVIPGAPINANNVDALSVHFPLCMRSLQMQLRKEGHLKHFGRLQYTLFLKGIGLSLDECILFWRKSFYRFTDDEFNSRYKYNIRHAYGEVGGDANRRGRGYPPFSCQKILTDNSPGTGQTHGCPYRHYSPDNLMALLQATGVNDRETLKGVRDDVGRMKYHIACNRVFEYTHREELKKVKAEGSWDRAELDTIVHPNTWFKRSYLLKQVGSPHQGGGGNGREGDGDVTMGGSN